MHRATLYIILFWSILHVMASPSTAEEPQNKPLSIITIDLSSSLERANTPFGAQGLIAERIERGASTCGLDANVIFAPSWNRAYTIAVDGRVDAIVPAHKTTEREEIFDFAKFPLRETQMNIFTDEHMHSTQISGRKDLDGKRVGILLGAMLEARFDAYVRSGGPVKSEQNSYASLVENLSRHKLDYIAGSTPVIEQEIKNQGLSKIKAVTPRLGVENVYLALSKNRKNYKDLTRAKINCLMNYNFLGKAK